MISIPFLGRKILDRRDMLHAGIVDQHVDAAQFALRLVDQRFDLIGLGKVGAVEADLHAIMSARPLRSFSIAAGSPKPFSIMFAPSAASALA